MIVVKNRMGCKRRSRIVNVRNEGVQEFGDGNGKKKRRCKVQVQVSFGKSADRREGKLPSSRYEQHLGVLDPPKPKKERDLGKGR